LGGPYESGFLHITPNGSLLKGITRRTPPRRAAGLRLAEHGRKAVEEKRYQRAVLYLEKALAVESSPFVHFYLARAHYQLADYHRARQFLEVAEGAFSGQPHWMRELARLKRALAAMPVAPREAPANALARKVKQE
jgi:uncharacterized protein HemY